MISNIYIVGLKILPINEFHKPASLTLRDVYPWQSHMIMRQNEDNKEANVFFTKSLQA